MSHKVSLKDKIENTAETFVHDVEEFIQEKWHHRLHRKARHHVHRLRQRPDHHKQIIAFSFAFVCTAVVFVLWYFFSLPRIFNEYKVNQAENARLERSANPLDDLKTKFQTGLDQ
ncbi:MAG: hypothetical protein RJB39_350 [Candidatus Parcubacteria bacterium]|jgi:type II secretory pathway component PulM